MRAFVLRARAAPTEAERFVAEVGGEAHTEILAHTLMNALFVAQSHRSDVVVYLVLESTRDFSRTVVVSADEMGDLGGFHEQALTQLVARALSASEGMGKEQTREVMPGVKVRTVSFERLVQELAQDYDLFCMDPKGTPVEGVDFGGSPCFLLTDHIPMPKKTFNTLKRLGAEKISVGRTMLFASQCVVLIHNALDGQ